MTRMQTHWRNRHYTLCYPSFTALLYWENVRYAYYSTKDWISYWINLYTRVQRNIVEDDEFHEHVISSVIHFSKDICHHGFGDSYYFNLIRSATQTSQCEKKYWWNIMAKMFIWPIIKWTIFRKYGYQYHR